MNRIAIIPARGGSKRIPKKNIQSFNGKPIIAYSIEVAIKSKLFDKIIVSTDSKEIAEIACEYGAEVPFYRSKKNSGDFATTFDVLDEVLSWYKQKGQHFDYGCCIYPAAPFVAADKLDLAFKKLIEAKMDLVFPVVKYSFPVQRSVRIKNERVYMVEPEHLITRSQDLEPTYHDAGQFYFFDVNALLREKKLVTKNTGAVVIDDLEAQDIDYPSDWKLAELKYNLFYGKN